MITTQSHKKNVFIVDNDPEVTLELKNLLEIRFRDMFDYFIFHTGAHAKDESDNRTDIVIINNYLTGENGTMVAESMKKRNPNLKIVMLTTNEEVVYDIEQICNQPEAPGVIQPPVTRSNRYLAIRDSKLMFPFRFIFYKEFRTKKYLLIFFVTFIIVGLISLIGINLV